MHLHMFVHNHSYVILSASWAQKCVTNAMPLQQQCSFHAVAMTPLPKTHE